MYTIILRFVSSSIQGAAYPDLSLLAVKYVVAVNGSFFPIDGTSGDPPCSAHRYVPYVVF